jgi:glycosyltransferase involved in cell wall biosynthesis
MNDIIISVIIPVYNSENTINACFDSVYNDLNQAGYQFEIILINDGSTDDSLKCLINIKDRYADSVFVINQPNTGVSAARNAGLKIAQGQYIAFCDSDDMWIMGKTGKSIEILKNYPSVKCLGGKYFINKVSIQRVNYKDEMKSISLIDQLFHNHFNPSTVILSKEIIHAGFFFNEKRRYSEDAEYFNRIVQKYSTLIVDRYFVASVINKEAYGESGLSANLWAMERGELNNIYIAYKELNVNVIIYIIAIIFSIIKYFKREIIVFIKKIKIYFIKMSL